MRVVDTLDGTEFTISTRAVVNATGVWADEIFTMAEHRESHRITPAKGVHISVASSRLPADVAAVLSVPGDRRSIFVVPFDDAPYTFIGTTDTAYDGSLDQPFCTPDDIQYLLDAVNASTSSSLSTDDVTGIWAGLRPLLKPDDGGKVSERTADLSRRHKVTDSHDGVIHITGGKWTTYRQMAEDTVDALKPYVDHLPRTRTKNLRLHGYGDRSFSGDLTAHLYQRYGTESDEILSLVRENPNLGTAMIDGQPYIGAEFIFAVRSELATSLDDLLTRRTRAHLHDARATVRAAPAIARLVAEELGWDEAEIERQVSTYATMARREFTAAGLTL